MRTVLFILTVVLYSGLCRAASCGSAGRELTVMTFNVRNGMGIDGTVDLGRTADVITCEHADIVAIQEIDSVTRRSESKYNLGELSAMTGMHALFAPAIDYEGGKYGVGLLCRERPDSVRQMSLPGREESRAAVVAYWDDIVVCGTHLSLVSEDALDAVRILTDMLRNTADGRIVLLAGDFNSLPESDVLRHLTDAGFRPLNDLTVATFPSDKPEETLDYIMCLNINGIIEIDSEVIDTTVSDHRPVKVSFKYGK